MPMESASTCNSQLSVLCLVFGVRVNCSYICKCPFLSNTSWIGITDEESIHDGIGSCNAAGTGGACLFNRRIIVNSPFFMLLEIMEVKICSYSILIFKIKIYITVCKNVRQH